MWKFEFLACRSVGLAVALFLLMFGMSAHAADYAAEAARLQKLADRGDAVAQSDLGMLYHKGLGVPQDAVEAARLYALAANRGNTKAQASLASLYYFGDGVPRDYAQAAWLARLAADKGDPVGQVILGACYAGGAGGLARDEAEAVRLYRLSADQNNGIAQLLLAGMYEKGRGVEKDPAEAFRLYGLSASQGTPQARIALVRLSVNRPDIAASAGPASSSSSSPPGSPRNGPSTVALSAPPRAPSEPLDGALEIPLTRQNGVLMVPVLIGDTVKTTFVVDSGASDVIVPEGLFQRLKQDGQLSDSDFIGTETHKLADGSTHQVKIFTIRSLQVGGRVLRNVKASLAPAQGLALLGQTFLQRFTSWSIDNNRQLLLLK